MKYSYEGANNSKLIKKYMIKHNKLIVKYFDNKTEVLLFNKEKEEEIKNIMLEQAINRDKIVNNIDNYDSFESEFLILGFEIILWLFTISNIIISSEIKNNILKIISYLVASYNAILSGYLCNNYFSKVDKKEELIKYRKYLSMRNELKKYINDSDLLEGLIHKKDILNINNLDKYTLVEIKQLESNVINIKKKTLGNI